MIREVSELFWIEHPAATSHSAPVITNRLIIFISGVEAVRVRKPDRDNVIHGLHALPEIHNTSVAAQTLV